MIKTSALMVGVLIALIAAPAVDAADALDSLSLEADAAAQSFRDFMLRGGGGGRTVGMFIKELLENYDLHTKYEAARADAVTNAAFVSFLVKEKIDPDTITNELQFSKCVTRWWDASGKYPPELSAWFRFWMHEPDAPWRECAPSYRILAKTRPRDLPPALLMTAHVPATEMECNEWLEALKKSYANATNQEQRSFCFLTCFTGATSLASNAFAQTTRADTMEWLRALRKAETSRTVRQKIEGLLWSLALASNAFEEAAEYSHDSPMRAWAPFWLMVGRKPDAARELIMKLKQNQDLSESEKIVLRKLYAVLEEKRH